MEKLLPLLKILASSVAKNVGGVTGWLYGKILFYGGEALLEMVNDWIRKLKREEVQKEKKKELDKVDQDPNAKPDEVGKKYEDYINS